jgi:Anti-sigma-K factor rskA/Putative zinc-finger
MNCDEVRELLAGFVLEALDADERAAVAHHLEQCPDCAALASALAAAAHELPLVLDVLDVPALPASVLERLERATARPARHGTRRWTPLPRALRTPLAAAAVIALAVIAVLAAVRSQQAVADEHDLRARLIALVGQQSIVFDVVDSPHTTKALLLPGHAGSRAYGKIYTRSDSRDAVAFVNRLAQPTGSERYLLWIRNQRRTARAGVFSLHAGFGYLVFHHNRRLPLQDAFVTLQTPSPTPAGKSVLKLARREGA